MKQTPALCHCLPGRDSRRSTVRHCFGRASSASLGHDKGWLGSTNGSPQHSQRLGAPLRYEPSHASVVKRHILFFLLILVIGTFNKNTSANDGVRTKPAVKRVSFVRQIQPLLRKHCYECHGREVQEGGLRLDRKQSAFAGSKNGKILVPGKSGKSVLLALVSGTDKRGRRMPPKDEGRPLTKAAVDLIRAWIDAGAVWPQSADRLPYGGKHWSFQPVRRPRIPTVKHKAWVRNPVDAFILSRLEAAGMSPAHPAKPHALIRRAYLDLTGLPPAPDYVDHYTVDDSGPAWEKTIDRLLADPHYGERWGRHWLDLVRYADSNGYEVDGPKPLAWKYRDYVIRALNADKRYNRFILEQLAGDELPDANTETVIATGFSRVGPWDAERGASVQKSEIIEERFNELDDMVSTTSQVFLGLTMGCARCHDHKFDPLTSRDYYSMVAIFSPLQRSRKGRSELTRPAVPPRLLRQVIQNKKKPTGKKTGQQFPQGYFLYEASPKAPVTHLLKRGNPKTPGPVVTAAVPAALVAKQPPFEKPDRFTSRRRISLARWIADPKNPLTSRVIVNRVWQHHFGYGLVRSANDFGRRGTKPTHPELLDWLAHWFVHDAKFSLKQLHRLIMTSNTYRMSKRRNKAVTGRDAENRLLSHFPYRRLEVEAIRDSMLAVSGRMTNSLYGPGMYPHIPADALRSGYNPKAVWKPFNERNASRRTIYSYVKRTLVVPFLDTFDFCDTTRSASRRNVSTVAPQALELLNGEFVNRQARYFADRLIREAGSDVERQIRRAYRLALGRKPTLDEREILRRFLMQERSSLITVDQQRNHKPGSSFVLPKSKLVLWLDARRGVERNTKGIVTRWADQSGRRHHATPKGTPQWVAKGFGAKPAVVFEGKQDWLSLSGKVLSSQQFSIFAVVNDRGKSAGHRNLFGNWNGGRGNSTTSVFLGTTQSTGGGRRVRLSDDYADTRLRLKNPERGFVLTAISEPGNARVFQNAVELGNKGAALSKRKLDTAWMVGRQGAAGEFWHGEISELLVYDRALNPSERSRVWRYLGKKYGLAQQLVEKPLTQAEAHRRALIQMCRVIFNLNEFVYTD